VTSEMAGAFDQNTPRQGAAKELAKPEQTIAIGSPTTVLSVRFMILQQLAETNQPTYSHTISSNLAQYGITKERILIELNKLNKRTSVSRETADGAYKYQATEKGLNELKRRISILDKERIAKPGKSLSESCNWLLENLQEPKSFDELSELFDDSDKTLSVLLSRLCRAGIAAKIKQPLERRISQRNRHGKIVSRKTMFRKTFYVVQDKLADVKIPKIEDETASNGLEPVLSQDEGLAYAGWRKKIRGKRFEKFHRILIANANKARASPESVYKNTFRRLVQAGLINVGHYYPTHDNMEE